MRRVLKAVAIAASVVLSLQPSMAASRQPVTATTGMSLDAYAGRYAQWVVNQMDMLSALKAAVIKPHLNLHVPQLIIYDTSGRIVYYGTDVHENASVLASLPREPRRTDVPDNALTRDGLFAVLPAFTNVKSEVVSNAHYLVYSVVPAGDRGAIGTQAAATRALRGRLGAAQVNLLEVEIATK